MYHKIDEEQGFLPSKKRWNPFHEKRQVFLRKPALQK